MILKSFFKEILYRLVVCFYSLAYNFTIIYIFKEEIFYAIGKEQQSFFPYFIAAKVTEIFFTYFKMSFFFALYASYTVFFLQALFFLAPALYFYEFKQIRNFFFFSLTSYTLATFLSFQIFYPSFWKFFSSFQSKADESLVGIYLETNISQFFGFFFDLFLSLNLAFHFLFLFFYLLKNFAGNFLINYRKLFYFFFLLFATLLPSPEFYTQIFFATFFIIFFEFFIYFFFLKEEYKKFKRQMTGFEPVTSKATV